MPGLTKPLSVYLALSVPGMSLSITHSPSLGCPSLNLIHGDVEASGKIIGPFQLISSLPISTWHEDEALNIHGSVDRHKTESIPIDVLGPI